MLMPGAFVSGRRAEWGAVGRALDCQAFSWPRTQILRCAQYDNGGCGGIVFRRPSLAFPGI